MLRVRLKKCRTSEQEAAATARDARDRVASALASRARLAARIVEAAEDDPSHRCAVTDVASDSQVLQWARRAQQPHPNDRWPV
jgi:hypothetical protein